MEGIGEQGLFIIAALVIAFINWLSTTLKKKQAAQSGDDQQEQVQAHQRQADEEAQAYLDADSWPSPDGDGEVASVGPAPSPQPDDPNREIREFFWSRDFLEVETPMLQAVSGGAAARPFETHFNALDCDFSLRIALELHLKRLLVGGFDRVFEVGRVFRNEGLSRRHNPEFTMLEAYQAYTDFRGMMELTQSLIQQVAERALGTLQMEREEGEAIDLSGDWKEAKYKDLILGAVGRDDWFELPKVAKL